VAERKRWSHSAFNEYTSCGERYRLRRIVGHKEHPGLPAAAGSAFHTWSELWDGGFHKDDECDFEYQLELAILKQEADTGIPRAEFKTYGRKTKANPAGETIEVWRDTLGPDLCEKYIEWRRDTSEWEIAKDLPPDKNGNTTGIEYELDFWVRYTRVRGYVDRVVVDQHGNYGAVDIKTWSRERATAQLPTYIVGLQKRGIPATWGAYYHARKGVAGDQKFFTSWNEERLAALYDQAATMQQAGFYLPQPSEDCGSFCSVAAHCDYRV
jgi:sarcosine oxidase delta subunit